VKNNEGEPTMDEEQMIENNRRKKAVILFSATFIALMFIAGYLVGGTLSSTTILQDEPQDTDNGIKNVTNITYIYNDTSLAALYSAVEGSVVVITGSITQISFFGTTYTEVQGSGFVYEYNTEYVIITNQHVVEDTQNITVTFSNGNAYPGDVIGADPYSDLAILSVDAPVSEFVPLQISSSSSLKVGDPVVAIGSPFGLGGTMTTGIVSQLGRTIQDSTAGSFPIANIIQTSVPINPGNSGGPLLNYQGEVIGITTAIIQNSNSLGFAIPSNTILREIQSLVQTGSYDQHPWLGVSGTDMTYAIAQAMNIDTTYGWLITQTTPGGAADNAGVQGGTDQVRILNNRIIIGGDIIIAIDGTRIINGDCLMSYLEEHTAPTQVITMTILRDNHLQDISVELGTRPAQ